MLLLVLLCAMGMFVVSLPLPVVQSLRKPELEAMARNMAKAGAHAAIARLPGTVSDGAPYMRRIPLTRNLTGKYAVTSRKSGIPDAPGSSAAEAFEEYEVLSEGGIDEAPGMRYRVRSVIRYPVRAARGRIVQWEETALP